jgi:DNA-binding XRE family transcriptional regulator
MLTPDGSQERMSAEWIKTIVCGLFAGLRISLRAMVGNELRKARHAAGLTQEQLASKAKLHPTYIGLLERGKRSPSLDVFLQLCAALEISPLLFLKRVLTRRDKKVGK